MVLLDSAFLEKSKWADVSVCEVSVCSNRTANAHGSDGHVVKGPLCNGLRWKDCWATVVCGGGAWQLFLYASMDWSWLQIVSIKEP